MLKNIIFTNQSTVENNTGMPKWAVISITDFGDAKIKQGWYAVHRSVFDDVDTSHPNKDSKQLMTDDHALEIVDFVHAVAPEVDGIIVHCRGGVSRSAAIAKWIAVTFNLPFNEKYQLFNTHVFDQMIKATAVRNRRPKP